ncbi:GGDEF domain-containing protein [uncultured Shewanella sp.]|uniref:GGDEF domain-containing protein n=1 Tax=uncultured Shewanella sp. TaxID=173975 RepID=UPI00261D93F5|nr:GGDEF domain-containing protein [uncultured Shewanella sp.]
MKDKITYLQESTSNCPTISVHSAEAAQITVLCQFINYLSKACKGLNLELDNKLADLRALFVSPNKWPQTLAELSKIEVLLKQHDKEVNTQLTEHRKQLTLSLEPLAALKALSQKHHQRLISLKKELKQPFHTYYDYIEQLEKVIFFYSSIINDEKSSDNQMPTRFQTQAIELTQIISEMSFHTHQTTKITEIKETLFGNFTLTDLLSAYQTILRLLQENIDRSQSASQAFLFTLDDALLAMEHITDTSQTYTQEQFTSSEMFNTSMSNKMSTIENHLIEIDDIDELKVKLIEQVANLHLELNQRQAQEKQSVKIMDRAFSSMKKQMDALNKETNIYKKSLFEQQKFHLVDPLTQLPNRAALEERMSLEFRHYQRHKQALWVIIADIDHFKSINDHFGHSTGDKTLQVIAMAFKNSLNKNEFVARFGGEEFVMLLPLLSVDHLDALLNRLRKKIKNIPFKFKNQQITVTVSIGAAKVLGHETIQDTFERADAALYRAKNESRDKVIIDL